MYEYEVNVTVEDKEKVQHIIKRYIVTVIARKPQLKNAISELLKKDPEISKYKLIKYEILNYEYDY